MKLEDTPLPINRVAARVVKKAKPEELWAPKPRGADHIVESSEFIPVGPLPKGAPKELLNLIGKRRDRMVVVGYAKDQGVRSDSAKWVVRCDCGSYEQRTRIVRWLGTKAPDMCRECRKRQYIKNGGHSICDRDKAERLTTKG